jgi:FdhD protein
MPLKTAAGVKCWQFSGGRLDPAEAGVIIEKELPVHVNGSLLFTASITPGLEKEFVTGYLFGQGFINSVSDIGDLDVKSDGARVTLQNSGQASAAVKASYRIVSGGGRLAYFEASGTPRIKSRARFRRSAVFQAMNTLFARAALYRETEGVHAAGLFTPEAGTLCIVEDIGRHNSLDKVIGYALRHAIDCRDVFLVSTGRMASEMVNKICRAGIPLAATKTAVTAQGLEISRACGLTLIGFVRDVGTKTHTDMEIRISRQAQMKIYCGAERVI